QKPHDESSRAFASVSPGAPRPKKAFADHSWKACSRPGAAELSRFLRLQFDNREPRARNGRERLRSNARSRRIPSGSESRRQGILPSRTPGPVSERAPSARQLREGERSERPPEDG